MSEILFILTIIFVAYVVYVAVDEHKSNSKSTSETKSETPVVVTKQQIPETTTKPIKPVPAKPTAVNSPVPVETTMQKSDKKGLRDPKTGEVTTYYSNYRFTKRWIKEALVKEGLLDKVYKNNELNSSIEASIKDALAKLEAMDKYKS